LRIGNALSHVINANAARIHHTSAELLGSRLAWSALKAVERIDEPTQKCGAIDQPFDGVHSTPDNASDISRGSGGIDGHRPCDRILSHSTQRLSRLSFGLLRLARNCPDSSIFGILQELSPVANDIARRTQLQILPTPDRFFVSLVCGGFSLPAKAGDLAALTIHEFRNAFAHASAPAERPPFLTFDGMLERGRHRAQRCPILPAYNPPVKNETRTISRDQDHDHFLPSLSRGKSRRCAMV
jgi:hypothetical protein